MGDFGGGSGGVVVLDLQSALESTHFIHTNGGVAEKTDSEDGCLVGGAGTIYQVLNDTLIVKNNDHINSTA